MRAYGSVFFLFPKRFRLSKVTREGKYIPSDVPKQLVYGTMVYVRQTIVADASNALSRAVCIATRYSAVRRQFGAHNGGIETQVLFQTHFTIKKYSWVCTLIYMLIIRNSKVF